MDLKIDARRRRILEILNRDGSVKVAHLSEMLGATSVTIRADLASLEKDGYLERITGGAILTVRNVYKIEFLNRMQHNLKLKEAIAAKTAKMICDGQTLIINSGTTTYMTAVELRQRKNLNIVTNSIEVARELGSQPTFRIILLGGDINSQYAFTHGDDAVRQLRNYKADYALLAMDGICSDVGLTTFHAEEVAIDRVMIERARSVIVTADSTKFDHEGFSFVTELNDGMTWVTDSGLPDEGRARLEACGLNVIIAEGGIR